MKGAGPGPLKRPRPRAGNERLVYGYFVSNTRSPILFSGARTVITNLSVNLHFLFNERDREGATIIKKTPEKKTKAMRVEGAKGQKTLQQHGFALADNSEGPSVTGINTEVCRVRRK